MKQENKNNIEVSENNETQTNGKTEREKDKEIFAQNLQFFRKKLNISQKEMAESISVSNKNISKWENAETIPDVFTIKKIADLFNVSIETLIEPMSKENKLAIKTKSAVPLRWKLYLLLMINAMIILITSVAFYILKMYDISIFPIYYLFIYMLPAMDLSIFIFLCLVTKRVDSISLSIFGWLVTICIYISFISTPNIEYIFLISIAYQILTPIFARLINSRKIIVINKKIIEKIKFRKNNKTQSFEDFE